MFLERISNFLVKNRKKIFFYTFFTIFIFMASGDVSFAADKDKTDRVSILNTWLASISAIAWVMIYFVTMLLDPWFTSWTTFWINDKLHVVWILVSNIVYFIFAFILIWIAFMNIIWKGDKWELKQAMPKFIVWVFIVPFSWLIVSLVVSLSNILTIAALQLPSDSFPDFWQKLNNIHVKTDCNLDFKKLSSGTWTWDWFWCNWKDISLWDSVKSSAFWLVSAYVYGLIKIDDLPKIKNEQLGKKVIKNLLDMILYIVFNLLFVLIFFILIVALWIVLLVRIIWLWIYMALSPLFWLSYFFWKDSWWDLMKKFNFTEFLWLAMVPVYTMLALSFWFVFLSVTMEWLKESKSQWNNSMFKIEKDTINFKPWISDEQGKDVIFKFKVTWGPFSQLMGENNKNNKEWFMSWLKWASLWFVWAIFMNIFWVVIFRIAIMAALQSSNITKEIVAPIKQFGDSVWSLVAKAPTYAPVFGGQSMQSMQNIAWQAQSVVQQSAVTRANKFTKDIPFFNNDAWKISSSLEKVAAWLNSVKWWAANPSTKKAYEDWIKAANWNLGWFINNTKALEVIKAIAKKANLPDAKIKEMKNNSSNDILKTIIQPLEKIFDTTNGVWWVIGWNSWATNINSKELEKEFKRIYSWTASISWSWDSGDSEQKIKVEYSSKDNTIPIRFEIWGKTIHLDNDGKKINSWSLDEFAKAINWKTKEEIKDLFSNSWLDHFITLDQALSELKTLLKPDWFKEKQEEEWWKKVTKFIIDLSKKK